MGKEKNMSVEIETRKYTVAEIADHNESAGYKYFSRGALKFFKQTRKSFRVIHYGERVFVYAASNRSGYTFFSFAEYNPKTGAVDNVSKPEGVYSWRSVQQIEDHIKTLPMSIPISD
jgi:hypothetical protein